MLMVKVTVCQACFLGTFLGLTELKFYSPIQILVLPLIIFDKRCGSVGKHIHEHVQCIPTSVGLAQAE